MNPNMKIKNLLSLAAKSGKIVSGEEICIKGLNNNSIYLIIISEEASNNTMKKFNDKANYRNVPIYAWQSKEELGKTIGKTSRTIVGILDNGFAQALIKYLQNYHLE